MLRRIHIRGYKSLADVRVELKPLSVIFGPNAAGKSNFLDTLQLVSRLATSRTLREAFEPPYRGTPLESFTFDAAGVPGLLQRESATLSLEGAVELSPAVADAVNEQIREMKRSGPNDHVSANGASKPHTSIRERMLRYRVGVEIMPKTGILRVADEYLAALNARGEPTKNLYPFRGLPDRRRSGRVRA